MDQDAAQRMMKRSNNGKNQRAKVKTKAEVEIEPKVKNRTEKMTRTGDRIQLHLQSTYVRRLLPLLRDSFWWWLSYKAKSQ